MKKEIVRIETAYSFARFEQQLLALKATYPFLESGSAGRSVMSRPLYYLRLGRGPYQVFYNAAHHANEWLTTLLLMKWAENYCQAYATGQTFVAYPVSNLFNSSSIYLIPMVNPDGVDLVNAWPNYRHRQLQAAAQLNHSGLPLPEVWKANLHGVDLNLNYPALWEEQKKIKLKQGGLRAGPRDYCGAAPLGEPESRALVEFTREHDFRLVIAYHTQGEEIYYQFNGKTPSGALTLARRFAQVSGYALRANPVEATGGGYKDWFIQEYGRPGFTIEAGKGINPIPASQFTNIYRQNETLMLLGAIRNKK
jgi:g-D-glutamyl-meso-diaminopimelate peptidase